MSRVGAMAALLALTGAGLSWASGVTGSVGQVPAGYTPWLLSSAPNQYVRQLAQCGDTMFAVGTISAIGEGDQVYSRGNAFSFSATTGQVTDWDPRVDGSVHTIAVSKDCSTAYLGGSFDAVGADPAQNLAAVDTTTGALRPGFAHDANSEVDILLRTHGTLLAGGTFSTINGASRGKLASLSPATGVATSYADLSITGSYPNTWTRVYNAQVSHNGDRLLVEGVFTAIAGQPRQQAAILDFGPSGLTLDPWRAVELEQPCQPHVAFYVREAAWSPDDSRIFVAATGGRPAHGPGSKRGQPRAGLCDAASAYPSTPQDVQHLWINYTGCDSYYTVVADTDAVYFSGHERWASNPLGCDHAAEGSVSRPGLVALQPDTGEPTEWNPTRSLGHGAVDMLLSSAGLWIASDNFSDGLAQKCGGITDKGGICFLPRE